MDAMPDRVVLLSLGLNPKFVSQLSEQDAQNLENVVREVIPQFTYLSFFFFTDRVIGWA
jgi:hypothetical protein